MKINIYVKDDADYRMEDLGIKPPIGEGYHLTDLTFNDNTLKAVWISPIEDKETGKIDMVFYTDFGDFRTPYTEDKHERLLGIIKKNIHNGLRG